MQKIAYASLVFILAALTSSHSAYAQEDFSQEDFSNEDFNLPQENAGVQDAASQNAGGASNADNSFSSGFHSVDYENTEGQGKSSDDFDGQFLDGEGAESELGAPESNDFLEQGNPVLYGEDALLPEDTAAPSDPIDTPPAAYPDPAIEAATLENATAPVGPNALSTSSEPPISTPQESGSNLAMPAQSLPVQSTVDQGQSMAAGTESDEKPSGRAYQPIPSPNEFAGTPPIPGSMRQLADGEAPDEYYIEAGDTLYDIGDQLLDEPTYWPKLWSINPHIKNPHFIYPGMAIRFYPGSDDDPPFLQVVIEEELPIEPEFAFMMLSEVFKERPFDPTITEVIDASQLEIPFNINEMFIDSGELFRGSTRSIRVPAFLYHTQKEPLAVVVKGTQGETSASPQATIVIKNEKGVSPGTTYTILRPALKQPAGTDALLYFYVANTKVTEKTKNDPYLLANISDPLLGAQPGDLIVEYISTLRNFDTASQALNSDLSSQVIAFHLEGQMLGKTGDFAVINSGSDKVGLGQHYNIYTETGYWDEGLRTGPLENQRMPAAVIRIVDTTDAGAIGLIVHTNREIRIGDSLQF